MLNLKILVKNKISEIFISKLLLEKKIKVSLIPIPYGVSVNKNEKSVDIVVIIENSIELSF